MSHDIQHHLRTLPHGPGFRFLDRLTKLEPGQAAAGEYNLRGDEWFLAGHFPGDPLMPGVLLLEAGAQLAGIAAQTDPRLGEIPGLKLAGVHHVKITDTARPGDTITIEAALTARLANIVRARITARLGGKILLAGEVTLGGGAA